MKLHQLIEDTDKPVIVHAIEKLLASNNDIVYYADPQEWDWRRDGILHVETVEWLPSHPDILWLGYYYQLRSGDYSDLEEYELDNIDDLQLKKEGQHWVLYYNKS